MYRIFGEDQANPGKQFKFLNCYLWLRSIPLWEDSLHALAVAKTAAKASEMDHDPDPKSNRIRSSTPTHSAPTETGYEARREIAWILG